MKKRKNFSAKTCFWCVGNEEYENYHNEEWGRYCFDDYKLFEKISLEVFQCGLSWITILKKRKHFRMAFDQFNFYKISEYNFLDVERLANNKEIIRHKGKILATINNASCAIELVKEFGSISNFIYRYKTTVNKKRPSKKEFLSLTKSRESTKLSNDFKRRGWKFIGPKNMYALMQSIGVVNDHLRGCIVGDIIED